VGEQEVIPVAVPRWVTWRGAKADGDAETGVAPPLCSIPTDMQDKSLFIQQKTGMNGAEMVLVSDCMGFWSRILDFLFDSVSWLSLSVIGGLEIALDTEFAVFACSNS
jgi:hypothetical protein